MKKTVSYSKSQLLDDLGRLALMVLASVIMAVNLKSFVQAGDLVPGGFNGLTLAMVVTVFFTWCADFLVLRHFGWVYLRTLVFSLIALLTVFLLRKAARLWPELSHRIDADLASVSTNCAVLGAAYLAAQRSYTLSQALTFALCGGLGVLVVLMSYAGLREEISLTSCPRPFRGPAIEMVTAGLMALALVGFYGLHLS